MVGYNTFVLIGPAGQSKHVPGYLYPLLRVQQIPCIASIPDIMETTH